MSSHNTLKGYYDWCVKYTATEKIHPFGIPMEDIIPTIEKAGYTVHSPYLTWATING